jgi:hypothetical protein
MNTYALLLKLSGLSIGEAAEFHGVRLDTVKRWNNGRDDPPSGALDELRGLIEQQERMAAAMLAIYREQVSERGKPEDIQISWDPSEWPCRSAAAMALARVAAYVTVSVYLLD